MNSGFGQSCRGYVLLQLSRLSEDQDPARRLPGLDGGRNADHHGGADARAEDVPARPGAAGILVDLQTMKAAVADPNIVKLDTRDVDEWIAEFLVALRQGLLPAQGPHPRRGAGSSGTA